MFIQSRITYSENQKTVEFILSIPAEQFCYA